MLEKYTFNQTEPTDLTLVNCGFEDCQPQHHWGPGVRDHYIIHLVTAGCGTFTGASGTYFLQKNQGFLISPGEVVEYQADQTDPWTYLWVGFHGLRAEGLLLDAGLSQRHPVFSAVNPDEYRLLVEQMLTLARGDRGRDLRLLGKLYELLACLIDDQEKPGKVNIETLQEEYLRQAVRFIAGHYARSLSIREIAAHVGLDRSYLYSLFRRYLKQTPKEYLTRFRIGKAAELLKTPLTISEVARSVGYEDALLFTKVFKKEKGMPPSIYRVTLAKNL
ncbi:MAG: AraC family transcriptional regulator [Clostridiaceae bacterium]|nr:AraC family transcriptional regulator [Clostridiaceae bacterium]